MVQLFSLSPVQCAYYFGHHCTAVCCRYGFFVGINPPELLLPSAPRGRYTLAISIAAALAPLIALAWSLHEYAGLGYDLIAVKLTALVVLVSWVRARQDKSLAKTFPTHPGAEKRVAVIGGGCAGIVACKEMLDEGHTVSPFQAGLDSGVACRTLAHATFIVPGLYRSRSAYT